MLICKDVVFENMGLFVVPSNGIGVFRGSPYFLPVCLGFEPGKAWLQTV
jgi:hypothetical protein